MAKRRVKIETCTGQQDVADQLFVQGATVVMPIEIGRIKPRLPTKYEAVFSWNCRTMAINIEVTVV